LNLCGLHAKSLHIKRQSNFIFEVYHKSGNLQSRDMFTHPTPVLGARSGVCVLEQVAVII